MTRKPSKCCRTIFTETSHHRRLSGMTPQLAPMPSRVLGPYLFWPKTVAALNSFRHPLGAFVGNRISSAKNNDQGDVSITNFSSAFIPPTEVCRRSANSIRKRIAQPRKKEPCRSHRAVPLSRWPNRKTSKRSQKPAKHNLQ